MRIAREYLLTIGIIFVMVAWHAWSWLLVLPAVWMYERYWAWEDAWERLEWPR